MLSSGKTARARLQNIDRILVLGGTTRGRQLGNSAQAQAKHTYCIEKRGEY